MRFPAWFQDASIRRKFIFISFLTMELAMLFAILLLSLMQWFVLHEEPVKNVSAQASAIASISAVELAFDDREAAKIMLRGLTHIDSIEFAEMLDKRGENFALFVRPGKVVPPHRHKATDSARTILPVEEV